MNKKIYLVLVLVLIVLTIVFLESRKMPLPVYDSEKKGNEEAVEGFIPVAEKEYSHARYNEIVNPSGFINTDNFTLSQFIRKKVILIDFWTYSCINCLRTLPYVNAWHEKYKDQGLLIVGIHSPEFKFEEEYANVQKAVETYGVGYPVVLDNSHATWRAYKNNYWPREYLIDIDGYIVYDHIGEGGYEETETKIRELLEERRNKLNISDFRFNNFTQPSNVYEVDFSQVKSPETYFGAQRNEYLENGVQGKKGIQNFKEPSSLSSNLLYLSGSWDITDEYAESVSSSKIFFNYEAKNVYIVANAERDSVASLVIDKKFVKNITVNEEKLYTLIEGDAYARHSLELTVPQGVKVFTLTFG